MYAQRTADGRIALGGRGVPYRFGSAVDHLGMTDQSTVAALTGVLRRLFPAAADARIAHAWCGVLGVPRDWCASVDLPSGVRPRLGGRLHRARGRRRQPRGRTLADLVTGERSPLTALPWVGHRSRSWEPEPARWAGRARALRALPAGRPARVAGARRDGRRLAGQAGRGPRPGRRRDLGYSALKLTLGMSLVVWCSWLA